MALVLHGELYLGNFSDEVVAQEFTIEIETKGNQLLLHQIQNAVKTSLSATLANVGASELTVFLDKAAASNLRSITKKDKDQLDLLKQNATNESTPFVVVVAGNSIESIDHHSNALLHHEIYSFNRPNDLRSRITFIQSIHSISHHGFDHF